MIEVRILQCSYCSETVDSSKTRPNNIIRVGNQLKGVRLCLYSFMYDPSEQTQYVQLQCWLCEVLVTVQQPLLWGN